MNYENMTDFEINSAVTACINNCANWEINDAEFYHCGIDGSGYYSVPILNYCNNPSDAWPIILENKIELTFEGGFTSLWESKHIKHIDEYDVDVVGANTHKNPLRAAMIVYLMMSDKNDT